MTRLQPFFSTIELSIGNLHLAEIQKIIFVELKRKSGIYGFICKTTNKLYIGSSINLNMRFNNHINGIQSNILLQNAINKYNLQDFIFIIFEYCEAQDLILREQFYIDELKPELNILKTAGSSLGYKHTEESLAKLSGAMTGKTLSEETKALISLALSGENHPRGMLGKTYSHSEESKTKISEAKGTSIYVYDTNGTLVNSFSSASKAALHFNVSKTTILRYIANKKIFKENLILSVSLLTKEK